MSDDLIDRLKEPPNQVRECDPTYHVYQYRLGLLAAEEIERLRRERDDEERRANILSDAIDYVLNVSHEGLPWLDDWFHGEPDAMHELDAWRARSRAALGEEKK